MLPSHSTCEVYLLRHLILQRGGLPDSPTWIRPQAWSVLLKLLGPEKRDWHREAQRKREEYYSLLQDLLPGPESVARTSAQPYDPLITQIQLDLVRSRFNAFSFFRSDVPASLSCPVAPLPSSSSPSELHATEGDQDSPQHRLRRRNSRRHNLLTRLRKLDELQRIPRSATFTTKGDGHTTRSTASLRDRLNKAAAVKPSPIDDSNSPASPTSSQQHDLLIRSSGNDDDPTDRPLPPQAIEGQDERHKAILRILFLYAQLNPSIGYVQGLVEVTGVVLWTMGSATRLPEITDGTSSPAAASTGEPATNPHFEADAFWCISSLLGELRELWDFEGLDHLEAGLKIQNPRSASGSYPESRLQKRTAEVGGTARALQRFGGRLKWADEELWAALSDHRLSPSLPYYSFRWFATILSTALPLPSLLRVWDALLSATDDTLPPSDAANSSTAAAPLSGKIEFFIDILTALLMSHRSTLLSTLQDASQDGPNHSPGTHAEAFGTCMAFLQDLPDDDIGPVLQVAGDLRQRRVAAALTGEDGPPATEFETSNQSMRNRAVDALRGWSTMSSSSDSPSRTNGTPARLPPTARSVWSPASRLSPKELPSTPSSVASSKISPASFLSRMQSSDTAAQLSKKGTNWTLKAMERWNGANSDSPLSSKTAFSANDANTGDEADESMEKQGTTSPYASPLSAFSSRFESARNAFGRTLSASSAVSSPSSQGASNAYPSLQWPGSEAPPDFPLPEVAGSPEGRTEYAYDRPQSLLFSPAAAVASLRRPSNASPPTMTDRRHSRLDDGYPQSAMGRERSGSSNTSSSAAGTGRSAGPKPLLLAGAARAAREPSVDEEKRPPPSSRVVRTGPLAGRATSPLISRGPRRLSAAGGFDSHDTTISSKRPSWSSPPPPQMISPEPHHNDGAEETSFDYQNGRDSRSSLQIALQTPGALPDLPSLASAIGRPQLSRDLSHALANANVVAAREENGVNGFASPSTNGSFATRLAHGTAPVAVFRGVRDQEPGVTMQSDPIQPSPSPHPVSSSRITSDSDMPLVASDAAMHSIRRRPISKRKSDASSTAPPDQAVTNRPLRRSTRGDRQAQPHQDMAPSPVNADHGWGFEEGITPSRSSETMLPHKRTSAGGWSVSSSSSRPTSMRHSSSSLAIEPLQEEATPIVTSSDDVSVNDRSQQQQTYPTAEESLELPPRRYELVDEPVQSYSDESAAPEPQRDETDERRRQTSIEDSNGTSMDPHSLDLALPARSSVGLRSPTGSSARPGSSASSSATSGMTASSVKGRSKVRSKRSFKASSFNSEQSLKRQSEEVPLPSPVGSSLRSRDSRLSSSNDRRGVDEEQVTSPLSMHSFEEQRLHTSPPPLSTSGSKRRNRTHASEPSLDLPVDAANSQWSSKDSDYSFMRKARQKEVQSTEATEEEENSVGIDAIGNAFAQFVGIETPETDNGQEWVARREGEGSRGDKVAPVFDGAGGVKF